MCGIAGVAGPEVSPEMPRALEVLAGRLAHRGPDDVGFLGWSPSQGMQSARRPDVTAGAQGALAHRRLSIIDLTDAAWQPMTTPDGRYAIVLNGTIYNYLELRAELAELGFAFRSQGDTEVLLAAWAAWGCEALNRLVGMFAFAVLDTVERTLVLVRDFFGIKPLYYARWRGCLVFASEIKALLALPGMARTADPQRLYDYLRFGLTDHGDGSLLAGIRQVPPAHWMQVSLDDPCEAECVRYWQIETEPLDVSLDEAAGEVRRLFLESIELHLRSDVPVGASVSGGIDSSAVLCGIRHVRGAAAELSAFTHVAPGALSEERWADQAARRTAAQIHKVHPRAEELTRDLDDLICAQGQPFGGLSLYAQFRVFRLAAEHGFKVLLGGQGADELLAGYRPYVAARALSILRRDGPWQAICFLKRSTSHPGGSFGRMLMRAVGLALPEGLQRPARRLAGEGLAPRWMDAAWFGKAGVRPRLLWRSHGRDALREHLEQSVTANALPMLLRYEDRNSMAHSVESRVPFLTPSLARFVLSLPEEYLLSPDGTSKLVFRRALAGIVPDAILARQDKIGFAVPEGQWLAALAPWVQEVLQGPVAQEIPALRPEILQRRWRRMVGRRRFDAALWRSVNLIRWAACFNVSFGV